MNVFSSLKPYCSTEKYGIYNLKTIGDVSLSKSMYKCCFCRGYVCSCVTCTILTPSPSKTEDLSCWTSQTENAKVGFLLHRAQPLGNSPRKRYWEQEWVEIFKAQLWIRFSRKTVGMLQLWCHFPGGYGKSVLMKIEKEDFSVFATPVFFPHSSFL